MSEQKKNGAQWSRFRSLLEDQEDWPTMYTFKFIAPRPELEELKAIFGDHPVKVRASRKGNYVSVTARMEMDSTQAVIEVYEEAQQINNVISL